MRPIAVTVVQRHDEAMKVQVTVSERYALGGGERFDGMKLANEM
jgi:hypothetical protein